MEAQIMARRRHRLAERRKAVGLSQERLAEAMEVDRATVARWESAESTPQPWSRPRLARTLKVSIEELAALLADVVEPSAPAGPASILGPVSTDLVTVGRLREQIRRIEDRYDETPSSLLLGPAGQLH